MVAKKINFNAFPNLRFYNLRPKERGFIIKIQKLRNFQENRKGKKFAPIYQFWVYHKYSPSRVLLHGKTRSIRAAREEAENEMKARHSTRWIY